MRGVVVLFALAAGLAPSPALAQGRTAPVEDQIDVVAVDRRLLAVNGRTGNVIEEKLERGEELIWFENRGQIGVAATTLRLLGVTARAGNWRELRYRLSENEPLPSAFYLGDRVALVPLATRLVAMGQGSTRWSELRLGPREWVEMVEAADNVGYALTSRRLIGFPSEGSSFAEIALTPGEGHVASSLEDDSVTITTPWRVLLFRVGAGRWTELVRTDKR
jgi:hypothetical protein